jgi:hypothetical protein
VSNAVAIFNLSRRVKLAEQSVKSARCILCEFNDASWNDLLTRIAEGEVVTVVGRGAVTFGSSDELLYPQLAQDLPSELDPPLNIYKHLHRIVENPSCVPGVTLAALAAEIKCGVKSPAIRTQISVTKLTRHYDKLGIRNVIPSSGLGSIATARPYPRERSTAQ